MSAGRGLLATLGGAAAAALAIGVALALGGALGIGVAIAGEERAPEVIVRARDAVQHSNLRALRRLLAADRTAAYEAVEQLLLAGDPDSLRLAHSIASAYADEFGDRRPAQHVEAHLRYTPEEQKEYARAVALKTEANEEIRQGRLEDAVLRLEEARAVGSRLGDLTMQARCVNNIGAAAINGGKGEEALRRLEEARRLAEQAGDRSLLTGIENNRAYVLLDRGETEAGRAALEAALVLAHEDGSRDSEGAILTMLGGIATDAGETGRADELNRKAIEAARAVGNSEMESTAWHNTGLVRDQEGNLTLAIRAMQRAARIARDASLAPAEIESLLRLSDYSRRLGRWDEAQAPLERARLLAGSVDSEVLKARVDNEISTLLQHRGQYAAAAARAEAAVARTRDLDVPSLRAVLRGTVASALYYLGDYERALAEARLGVEDAVASASRGAEADARMGLGHMLLSLGDSAAGLAEFERAMGLNVNAGDSLAACHDLASIGGLRIKVGDLVQARAELERAAACLRDDPEPIPRAEAEVDLAEAELAAGPPGAAAALVLLQRAGAAFRSVGDRLGLTHVALVDARARLLTGDTAGARRALNAIASFRGEVRSSDYEWLYHDLDARVAEREGDGDRALRACKRAVTEVERLRFGLRPPIWRAALLDDRIAPYREMVRLYLGRGDLERAYGAARLAKARGFAETILPPDLGGGPGSAPARGATGPVHVALDRSGTPADPETLRGAEPSGAVASASRLRAQLRDGEVLLDYLLLEDEVVVFVLRRDGLITRRLPVDPRRIAELAEAARYPGRPGPADAAVTEAWRGATERLGRLLLDPLAGDLAGVERLLIVPNGPLHSVPFATLPLAGRRLIEEHTLVVLPAAEALFARTARSERDARPGPARRALLIGDPDVGDRGTRLPGAAREVGRVAGLLGADAEVATGSSATEAFLRARAPGADVLHVAAHGRIDRLAPWRSRLDLAAGGGADGLLTAEEIAGTDVGAGLVVLSGCETAAESAMARDDTPGDEREGLVRAFLRAGAGTVVASLWEIDDGASADIFPELYPRLGPGRDGGAALARLQRELLAGRISGADGKRLDHPFYWAGLVAYGAGR